MIGDDRVVHRADGFPKTERSQRVDDRPQPAPPGGIDVEIVGCPSAAQYIAAAAWMLERSRELGGVPVRVVGESELVIRLPDSSLREIEMDVLRLALRLSEGRVERASKLLGITRHALRRKLKKFGLTELRAGERLREGGC